jgi:1-acyl-sn-glycerol-3-phosphate acyltransferase
MRKRPLASATISVAALSVASLPLAAPFAFPGSHCRHHGQQAARVQQLGPAGVLAASRGLCLHAVAAADGLNGSGEPPVPRGLRIGSKIVTPYGLRFFATSLTWALVIFPFVAVTGILGRFLDPGRLRWSSFFIQVWSRISLRSVGMRPKFTGMENLPDPSEAVLYTPNHTSLLDVPVTGCLPRRVKYLSKAELAAAPIVGWSLVLAGNLLVYRQSAKTFRKLIDNAAKCLRRGNSLVVFAEGTRSKDGRLQPFKKGAFLMAQKAGVRIVPISITGVSEVMPPRAGALPLRQPKVVGVRIHPPISTEGREVDDVMEEVRLAVASGLPDSP